MGKFDEQFGMVGNMVGGAAQTFLGGLAGQIWGKQQDERQLEQQKKLTEIGVGAGKDMAAYNAELQYDMWNKTNYGAQMKHLQEAGLNPALIYGMSGGGGATTGSPGGSVAGTGQAANAAQTMQANTAMGMQLAQMRLLEAQTEKTKVEADKIAGVDTTEATERTKGISFQNQVNELTTAKEIADRYHTVSDKLELEAGRMNAEWEAFQAAGFKGKSFDDPNSPLAKALSAGFEQKLQELKQAKTENNILKAEEIINNFKADLTKQGLSPESPWYVKFLGDMIQDITPRVKKTTKPYEEWNK